MTNSFFNAIPWDSCSLRLPAWELKAYSKVAIEAAVQTQGHHTVRVDPLADKSLLYENGFYYCDTLIEPFCNSGKLRPVEHPDAQIEQLVDPDLVSKLVKHTFRFDRFHRDFKISNELSDLRYANWLMEHMNKGNAYSLTWQGDLAGFICADGNKLVLHAVLEKYRGGGFAKYWWSKLSNAILGSGAQEVLSSVSVANLAALNLYASLGFGFRNVQDIYHKLVE
jgi:hypothetical protein